MMKKLFIGLAILLLVIIAAIISPIQKYADKASIANGQRLYNQLCLECHGATGAGEGALIGTSINNQQFLSTFSNFDIKNMIENGRVAAMMPAYNYLKEEEKEDLVSFIRSWQTEPLTLHAPSTLDGNVDRGRVLYASNCMTCHGKTGSGYATAAVAIANPDTLKQLSDKQLWLTIAYGREGTRMGPSLIGEDGIKQLAEQEVSDIVIYIRNELAKQYNSSETRH